MDGRLDVLVEPLSLLMSELTEIAARIESVHKSHAARVEAAAVQLHDALTQQVTADLRTELEERLRAAGNQWAIERDSLLRQIATLRKTVRRELSIEIAQSEAALKEVRTTIQAMVSDPSIGISKLVRAKAREGELAAYLKGLHFKAASSGESATERHDTAIAGNEVQLPA